MRIGVSTYGYIDMSSCIVVTQSTMKNHSYRLVPGRMGCFLCPPGHAAYSWEFSEGQNSTMSVEYAAKQTSYPGLAEKAKKLLAANPGTMTEEWVRECYKHFSTCYSTNGKTMTEYTVAPTNSLPAEHHMACLHIRQYFPSFVPRVDLH